MAREQSEVFILRQVKSNTSVSDGLLYQPRDMLVRKTISGGFAIITRNALKEPAKVDLGEMQILLKRRNRTSLFTGTSANLNFTPTGFATKRQDRSTIHNGNPSFAIACVILIAVVAEDWQSLLTKRKPS